jgi:hypothetical protein
VKDPRTSTTSWSIPSAARDREDSNPVPGPGSYNPNDKKNIGPAYGIGTKFERVRDTAESPGPAAYSPEKAMRSVTPEAASARKNLSFGTAKREVKMAADRIAPGPGSYSPLQPRGPRGYSMTPRRKAKINASKQPQYQGARTQFH